MRIRRITIPAILAGASLILATVAIAAEQEKDAAAEAGATYESTVPAAKIPKAIINAVNSPDRPATDKKLDESRKPEQTLEFFGIEPGMKVADLWAGNGYMTELLARVVGPEGKVYSQNGKFPPQFQKAVDAWKARPKEPGLSNVVELEKPFDNPSDILPVAPGSLDAVITEMNYHDMSVAVTMSTRSTLPYSRRSSQAASTGSSTIAPRPAQACTTPRRSTASTRRSWSGKSKRPDSSSRPPPTCCAIRRTIAPGSSSSIAASRIASC
jgi:hypothetical protein